MRRIRTKGLLPWAALLAIAAALCHPAAGQPLALADATSGGAPAPPKGDPILLRYGIIDPPVILEHDITIRLQTSIHPLDPAPKPMECSSVCWAQGRLVLASDRHGHVVFTLPLNLELPALDPGLPQPQALVTSERFLMDDLEALAARERGGDWSVYAMCSMSNDSDGTRRPKRQHFARFTLDQLGVIRPGSVSVISTESIRDALQQHFEALHIQPYESFDTDQNRNTPRWGNVEGIAWSPVGDTLICGLRTPMAGEDAMLFALEGVDQALDSDDPSKLRVTDLFRINLGGRGVSDLCWDPVSRGYLITAGLSNGPKLSEDQPYPLEHLDSALYWWSGQKQEPPRLIAKIAGLNIDGVCRIGQSRYIALASDEGDVSEGRQGRQSVLMVLAYPFPPAGGAR